MYCGSPSLWNFRAGDIVRALSINFFESGQYKRDIMFRRDYTTAYRLPLTLINTAPETMES
jgi:hypothetical protein